MKLGKALLVVAFLALGAGSAFAQSIGVFADPAGLDCDGTFTAGMPGTLYVIARSGPQAPDGLTTVEFYVRGFPGSWFAIPTYNPASNVNLGDMFKPSPGPVERFNQAYPTCQPWVNGMITIATVTVFPQTVVPETYLTVEVANPPSNAAYTRPVMILCDPPVYTAVMVNGGQFIMNGRPCTVGVEDKTWSQVKGLFSN